jgi:predicted ester cyclase
MSSDGNAAIYRAALDRANTGDLAGYLDLYSDDVVFGGVSQEPMDKAGVVASTRTSMRRSPGIQVEVLDLIESGDQLAARLLLSGPHEGPFLGVPASGNDVQLAITTDPHDARRQVRGALVDGGHARAADPGGGRTAAGRLAQDRVDVLELALERGVLRFE